MRINSNDVTFLCGNIEQLEKIKALKRLNPFSEIVCDFLIHLSSKILNNIEAKQFPDVVTFGFFCRKANISKLKSDYSERIKNRLGRGVSFHIAPSNVPINFAYSMVSALLAGNSCIVRASSKPFRQIDIVCECIKRVLNDQKFSELADYIVVMKYDHNKEITDEISSISDIRIIWGGDNTIFNIRKSLLPPRAVELTFADRYSIAVINSDTINSCENMHQLAQNFYNDTYLYDQNACSSPRLIYWFGGVRETEKAQEKFWDAIHNFIKEKYIMEPVVAVNKYTSECKAAIDLNAKIIHRVNNLISRINVPELRNTLPDYRCAGGSFIEYRSENLDELMPIITEKYQTLSYFGIDKQQLANFVINNGLRGVDRIVPIGKTADFELVWDGYELITQMSRAISF